MRKLALALILAACHKDDAARCAHCGMKIDPKSIWTAEVVSKSTLQFDTPRCAFTVWLTDKQATVRLQDYYDRAWHTGSELRFVVGSDIVGPMGADLVPVMPAAIGKFEKDHGGHDLALAEIEQKVLTP